MTSPSSPQGRRGFIFSMDALLAAIVIIGGLVYLGTLLHYTSDTAQLSAAGQDLLVSLGNVRVADINDSWVQARIADGTISDGNISALEQIGHFWATNDAASAQRLSGILLNGSHTSYGLRLSIGGTSLYERNTTKGGQDLVVASRMITGIAQGQAITGSSASAYLRHIRDKRTSSFLTFGGFIGQGNITTPFPLLPNDTNISGLQLEVDAAGPFNLYINNQQCLGVFTPTPHYLAPDVWDITACNASFARGVENNISVKFLGAQNVSYFAGGYLRARYTTDQIVDNGVNGTLRHYIPGVDGFVNIYDAFYIPGTLRNLTMRLHYKSNVTTYATIGGSRVYVSNGTGEVTVTLTDADLTAFPALLDYNFLSNKTVPLRIAAYNVTIQVVVGSNADIVLITDKSGSMAWRLDMDNQHGNQRSCNNPDLYHKDDTQRLALTKCLDIDFTDIAMNTSMPNNQNREWLVSYSDNAAYYSNNLALLTHDNLVNEIGNYKNPNGGTCIACALNLAYNILAAYSPTNKTRFVVLMTDGLPTYCTSNSGFCNTTGTGTTGTYTPAGCTGDTSDCSTNHCSGPVAAAINASRRLHNSMNATVYTIGVGPVTIQGCNEASYLLSTIANEANGTYYASRNASRLQEIYREIAYDILLRTSQTSQFVTVEGNASLSRLYPDSYLDITYDPATPLPQQGEIDVRLQSPQFGSCSASLSLPTGVRFLTATATSYSGEHWTDYLVVNGNTVFNLTDYGTNYVHLGDPYEINVPGVLLTNGTNSLRINTADNPGNSSSCSPNDSLIYSAVVNLSVERSNAVPNSAGCKWTIGFPDNTTANLTIPTTYVGNNSCSYRPGNITYDASDAYQLGAYMMFHRLDFNKDGTIFVNLREEDLEVIVTTISRVPYLWGPSIVTLEVAR